MLKQLYCLPSVRVSIYVFDTPGEGGIGCGVFGMLIWEELSLFGMPMSVQRGDVLTSNLSIFSRALFLDCRNAGLWAERMVGLVTCRTFLIQYYASDFRKDNVGRSLCAERRAEGWVA